MSIGIFTFQDGTNYGATYQMYALQEVLKRYDRKVNVINYKHEKKKKKITFQQLIFSPIKLMKEYQFKKFRKQYINLTKEYHTKEIKACSPNYDIYIAGSDQIWNPRTMDEQVRDVYFLNFGDRNIKKIAYAPSIGVDYLTEDDEKYFAERLQNFNDISVREDTGKRLINHLTKKEVTVVLDPTLLLSQEEWKKLEKNNKLLQKEKYIFVYLIEPDDAIIEMINGIAKQSNLKIIHTGFSRKYNNEKRKPFANPNQFLTLLHHADIVLTNSFHGTVFSIIFEKEFFCFSRKGMNSRMKNLLKKVQLESRFIENQSVLKNKFPKIDFNAVKLLLEDEKQKSISYLERALKK